MHVAAAIGTWRLTLLTDAMSRSKHIRVSEETKRDLEAFGDAGDTYDDVVSRLLEIAKESGNGKTKTGP